ncbi:hypothetical protein GWI33_019275 [Rhynchophorus ferrugineus]|uniref:Uncharacterized protein n=1 Tax=Rhynchophorus ferrugineus TaxID=354439 RepID=A0A834M4C3_RHYFE|nr:hypothetical protein GWI33_019275 [Rhynchophorus ferrugineus]
MLVIMENGVKLAKNRKYQFARLCTVSVLSPDVTGAHRQASTSLRIDHQDGQGRFCRPDLAGSRIAGISAGNVTTRSDQIKMDYSVKTHPTSYTIAEVMTCFFPPVELAKIGGARALSASPRSNWSGLRHAEPMPPLV